MKRLLPLTLTFVLAACSTSKLTPPSLAPRAAEKIDPRVPVERVIAAHAVATGFSSRLVDLVAEARSGDSAFRAAIGPAQRAAGAASTRYSDSWVVAQQALSVAQAARTPTTRALTEIDAIAGEAIKAKGGIGPEDLAAIEAAAREVGAIDERQTSELKAIGDRLGS